jgi:uncharacterized protein (TIGR01777 family)
MQTVLITGGTGLVGKALTKQLLEKGYQVIILTRAIPENGNPAVQYALWDVHKKTIDANAIKAADYIVHLAGAGVVDKKWTASYKQEIQDSRTQSSALLITAMQQHCNKVKAVVSSSAIGWYGADSGNKPFIESVIHAPGFLGETCKLWEQSIEPVQALGKRLVKLRIGIVLSNDGGALAEFKKPIQFGIAGILGSGKQMISWIHIDDLCHMFIAAIENEQLSGSYNAVAPHPVNNETLTLTLAKLMKGRFFIPIPVPIFVLNIMLGDRSIEVLKSTTVSCKKIEQAGFTFLYPFIDEALKQLCCK